MREGAPRVGLFGAPCQHHYGPSPRARPLPGRRGVRDHVIGWGAADSGPWPVAGTQSPPKEGAVKLGRVATLAVIVALRVRAVALARTIW